MWLPGRERVRRRPEATAACVDQQWTDERVGQGAALAAGKVLIPLDKSEVPA